MWAGGVFPQPLSDARLVEEMAARQPHTTLVRLQPADADHAEILCLCLCATVLSARAARALRFCCRSGRRWVPTP